MASFGKLKYVTASNFSKFRDYFKAECLKGFVCHANTFDNVKGDFPIGFLIWNLGRKKDITEVDCDIFDKDRNIEGNKKFISVNKGQVINDWLRNYYDKKDVIGYLRFVGPDFQANSGVYITSKPKESDVKESRIQTITKNNIKEMSIYISVRHCIEANWLNDRDQFLYPNDGWEKDKEFQNDCLAFALFHGQNRISATNGVNHWIPFIEWDVGAHDKFDSHFMTDFIEGKVEWMLREPSLFYNAGAGGEGGGSTGRVPYKEKKALKFSKIAKNVFKAGQELWKYYHAQPNCNANASLYDIREHFQGRNAQGKMNNKSDDEKYNELIGDLRSALKELAQKIEPKVYEYGFLKG